MNGEIIAVGSELLLGQIVNSNAKYLSEQLSYLGINVYHHSVVGDNESRLEEVLEIAKDRSDLVILTGGLGPTKDDLTKETVGKLLKKKLVYDTNTEERILQYFNQRDRQMTENNRKQALIVEGAHVFPNDHGLACGLSVPDDTESLIIMLPGPPKELQPMFEKYVVPYLHNLINENTMIESRVLRFFDIGESQLVEKIDDLLVSQTNPTIAPLASDGEVTLRLTVSGNDHEENKQLLDTLQRKILFKLNDYFVGTGEETLEERLVALLKQKGSTITTAESITGGFFASVITKQPGASKVFPGGFVTYGNKMKELQLNISPSILQMKGAVSGPCAVEMAMAARKIVDTDYGISFTGVAGPDPLEGKPPGTVFIGIATRNDSRSYEVKLAGSREAIRDRTVKYGTYYLLQWIRKEMEKVDE
ncbi:competence/damage-inducible protein A [Evansella sp. AB-P1]|uniref:competence/damage-inducible protein A n=1 Tax=Evansella sp. AB-P1 TaxID=3037653 RepID=UPI00242021AC|nr:competence/damage-inducible protein A [Evansella sp. AB-P1]MDG5789017.1 competence/damage-inducible protein A [Evansella sp. AB-P1]